MPVWWKVGGEWRDRDGTQQGLRVSKVRGGGVEDNRRRDGNWSPATSWEGWFSEGTAGGCPIIFGFSRGGHYFWSAACRNLNSARARNSVWPSWKWSKKPGYLGENYTRTWQTNCRFSRDIVKDELAAAKPGILRQLSVLLFE